MACRACRPDWEAVRLGRASPLARNSAKMMLKPIICIDPQDPPRQCITWCSRATSRTGSCNQRNQRAQGRVSIIRASDEGVKALLEGFV